MPVYEYRCRDCEAEHDRLVSHARADTPEPCEACGGALQRRFSRVGVKLEGWGFARNDALVPERPGGRNDWRRVKEKAEQLSDTGEV